MKNNNILINNKGIINIFITRNRKYFNSYYILFILASTSNYQLSSTGLEDQQDDIILSQYVFGKPKLQDNKKENTPTFKISHPFLISNEHLTQNDQSRLEQPADVLDLEDEFFLNPSTMHEISNIMATSKKPHDGKSSFKIKPQKLGKIK